MYKQIFSSSALLDSTPTQCLAFISGVHQMPAGQVELSLEISSVESVNASAGDESKVDTCSGVILCSVEKALELTKAGSVQEMEGGEISFTISQNGDTEIMIFEQFDSSGKSFYIS